MAWRLARSLETLRSEILARHPGTTFWTIGDPAHAASASDHNPNSAGVVCAADVLGNAGLDLAEFAEQVRTSGHPAFKYVIFNRRIASKGGGWRSYGGSNPHTTHVHVSVGVGPDGRSTGPYDDTSPWGINSGEETSMIGLRKGDKGERVKALQSALREAGHDPGAIDGDYGSATSAALLACRKAQGSSADSGDWVSGWAHTQLLVALAKRHAGRDGAPGKDGKPGEQGPPGPPGQVDLPAQLHGEVVLTVTGIGQ